MKIYRIYGVILRYLFLFRHSYDRLSDAFYWPTVDLLLFGLTSSYFSKFSSNSSQIMLVILSGVLFWIIVWRGQYEVTVNLLEDLWNRNLVNIFVSPLKFSEWIVSFLILGIIKSVFSFSFAMLLAYLLYKVQLFMYGFYLIPLIFLLMLTGWWVGFLIAGVILRYGTRVQVLAWTTIFVLAPFSAIYYPLSVLPSWAQTVATIVPTSYIFEASREIINTGHLDPQKLIMSLGLNVIYLAFSTWFLYKSFKVTLNKGLVKVF